jgi:UDP-2,3-diacylglucosamine pyrophosphatase LpxH
MPWWSRMWRRAERAIETDERIIVISDLHLGEDVVAGGPEHLGDYIRALNRQLADFVRSHCDRRKGRWHLVVNGDMMDFVKVAVSSEPDEAFRSWRQGLGDEALPESREQVLWKLVRIMEIHRPFFRELARFLAVGNRATIVEGNHDAEFYFPEVQQAIRQFVEDEAQKLPEWEDDMGEQIRRRFTFGSWFIAQVGRYHIEHGHQYDRYCSFEYNLVPVDHHGGIAVPLSHKLLPYFSRLLGDFSTHGIEEWSFSRWMSYIFNRGPRMTLVLLWAYFQAMRELVPLAGRARPGAQESARMQRTRLRSIAKSGPYEMETLRRLERLKAKPAEHSILSIIHLFYLDRFILLAAGVPLAAIGLWVGGHGLWLAGATAAGMVAGLLALSWRRAADIDETLRGAAARIAAVTGARYVVFGHSHEPELINLSDTYGVGPLGAKVFYVNSGSWVTREVLRGDSGKGMTYVEIAAESATLKRWNGADRVATVLAST